MAHMHHKHIGHVLCKLINLGKLHHQVLATKPCAVGAEERNDLVDLSLSIDWVHNGRATPVDLVEGGREGGKERDKGEDICNGGHTGIDWRHMEWN